MIVPVGHEHTQVRRVPVVFLAIVALNLAVHGIKARVDGPGLARMEAARAAAFDYLADRPYLTLDTSFVLRFVGREDREALQAEIDRLRERVSPPAETVQAAEQERLQRLCAAAVREEEARPRLDLALAFVSGHPTLRSALTAMFTHADGWHLFGNMLFFYLTAPFLEDVYGRVLFVFLYLGGGLGGCLAHMLAFPDSEGSAIGASGAISALLGAFLVRFFATRLRFVWILPIAVRTFTIRAYVALPFFLVTNVVSGIQEGEQAHIGYWCHVGGFVCGFLLALAVKFTRLEQLYLHPAIERAVSYEASPSLVRGLEALAGGEAARARPRLLRALRAAPDDADIHLALYRAGVALGDDRLAQRHANRHLELELPSRRADWLVGFCRHVQLNAPAVKLPASLLLQVASCAERSGDRRTAIDILGRVAAENASRPVAARALGRASALRLRAGDARAALDDLDGALRVPGLDPAMRRDLCERRRQVEACL